METNNMKEIYSGAAGIRNIVLLIVMFIVWGVSIGVFKSQLATAQSDNLEAKKVNEEHDKTLNQIETDIALLKDDQGEIEETLSEHTKVLNKQTILLERMAMKMKVNAHVNN